MHYPALIVAAAEELSALLYSEPAFSIKPRVAPTKPVPAIHPEILTTIMAALASDPKPSEKAFETYARVLFLERGHVVTDTEARKAFEQEHAHIDVAQDRTVFNPPEDLWARLSMPFEDPEKASRALLLWMSIGQMFDRSEIGGTRGSPTRVAGFEIKRRGQRMHYRVNQYRRSAAFAQNRAMGLKMMRVADNPRMLDELIEKTFKPISQQQPPEMYRLPDWLLSPQPLDINFRFSDIKPCIYLLDVSINNRPDDFSSHRVVKGRDTLEEIMSGLIGLENAKSQIRILHAALMHEDTLRQLDLIQPDREAPSHHLVFAGPPGTAKTTFARLAGKLYHQLGILPTSKVVEVKRENLVDRYIGQTAPKTRKVIDSAHGGILFIDEAYTLDVEASSNDFGREALEEIMGAMENERGKLVVIMAGYPDKMKSLMRMNPGLTSRFRMVVGFPAYSDSELLAIFDQKAKSSGLIISPETRMAAEKRIVADASAASEETFGNGRYIRNLVDATRTAMAARLHKEGRLTPAPVLGESRADALRRSFGDRAAAILLTPTPEDVRKAELLEEIQVTRDSSIGFGARLKDDRRGARPA